MVLWPEGIQKLMFPDILGAGRFLRIGVPYPDAMGPFVGVTEIVCGALIIAGLFTRLAAIPLIAIMILAIVSTKIPILLGQDIWIFHLPKMPHYGFLEHCARGARRCLHAACCWRAPSPDRGRRKVVARCMVQSKSPANSGVRSPCHGIPADARALLAGATFLGGILAGGAADRVIVGGPAWHALGAPAWAQYSRLADLVAYPV